MTFVELKDFRCHYQLEGASDARVLVLAHSLGTSSALWNAQVAGLGSAFRLLTIDFRGHGLSAAPAGPHSVAMLGNDVLALLDALGIESIDYAGVSLGGLVGQWLAAHAPRRIRRLVLANTAARIGTREHWDARMTTVAEHGLASIAGATMQRWFSPAFIAANAALVERFNRTLVEMSPDGYVATCAAIRDADHRALVREIACPTLVIAGALDQVTTPADGSWLADHIPDARVVTVPAAHLANVEASAEFNMAVNGFLSSSEV